MVSRSGQRFSDLGDNGAAHLGGANRLRPRTGDIAGAQPACERRGDRVYTPRGKPRSRVVVRQRSYLDPGTEVLPGERSYTEYAVPFGFSAMGTALGPTFSWDRRPFNNPWDVPHRYGW